MARIPIKNERFKTVSYRTVSEQNRHLFEQFTWKRSSDGQAVTFLQDSCGNYYDLNFDTLQKDLKFFRMKGIDITQYTRIVLEEGRIVFKK